MRIIAISLCALAFAATPAWAREGNPVTGIGVSVEQSPGGIRREYDNATNARADCIRARGTFTNTAGRLRCANPRTQLQGRSLRVGDPRDPSQTAAGH